MEFGSRISRRAHRRVLDLREKLSGLSGVDALVPTYRSLFVGYDPLELSFEELSLGVEAAGEALFSRARKTPGRQVELPVCYHPSLGPDLADVAQLHGLADEEVVALHTAPLYRVYLLGFTPGFAFLGGLDPRLNTPRLAIPRTRA